MTHYRVRTHTLKFIDVDDNSAYLMSKVDLRHWIVEVEGQVEGAMPVVLVGHIVHHNPRGLRWCEAVQIKLGGRAAVPPVQVSLH